MKRVITIPKDKYYYIQELEQGNTDYATTRMLYHAVKHSKPYLEQESVLDKIKNEFIDRYPRNYANELELGGRSCVFSLNEILRIINKYTEESKEVAEDGKIN